ncbi:BON domain-containing protein [Hydrogenophaga sp.]|jgi:hyperosmotically inducible protein|uniref:BON domain-containing protein n=1 Tax=Hydrogenophaga sp. TaxID=1904254 RepID=UPI003F70BDF2
MQSSLTHRFISVSAVSLALASLVACGKTETPVEAPPAAPPMTSTPAPATAPAETPPAMSASGPSTTMGEKVDDTVITTKVKTALLADDTVKGMDISVTTTMGEVQLSGVVDNQMQIDKAVEVAKAVEGVQRVQNGMTVKQ